MSSLPKLDILEDKKRTFIMNALDNGWTVKKRKGSYVFSKRHEGRREILRDGYLEHFLSDNMNIVALNKLS